MGLPSIKETSRLFGDARLRSVGIAALLAVGPVISTFLRKNSFSCPPRALKAMSLASSLESLSLMHGGTSKSEDQHRNQYPKRPNGRGVVDSQPADEHDSQGS